MASAERPVFHPVIGKTLKDARLRRGWSFGQTVIQAAKRNLPITKSSVRYLEEGKTKHPDAETLKAVAVLYGLSYRDLAPWGWRSPRPAWTWPTSA